jgi:hypothetical protein
MPLGSRDFARETKTSNAVDSPDGGQKHTHSLAGLPIGSTLCAGTSAVDGDRLDPTELAETREFLLGCFWGEQEGHTSMGDSAVSPRWETALGVPSPKAKDAPEIHLQLRLSRDFLDVLALGQCLPAFSVSLRNGVGDPLHFKGIVEVRLVSEGLLVKYEDKEAPHYFYYDSSGRKDGSLLFNKWRAFPEQGCGSFLSPLKIFTKPVEFTLSMYEVDKENDVVTKIGENTTFTISYYAGEPCTIALVKHQDGSDAGIVVVDGEDLPLISLACLDEWGNRTAPRSDVAWTFLIESNDWLPGAEAVKAVVEPTTGEATLPVLRVNAAARTVPETGVSVSIVVRLQCGCGSDGAAPTLTIPVTIMPSTDSSAVAPTAGPTRGAGLSKSILRGLRERMLRLPGKDVTESAPSSPERKKAERRRRRKWALRLQSKDVTDSSPSSPERKKARVQRPLSAAAPTAGPTRGAGLSKSILRGLRERMLCLPGKDVTESAPSSPERKKAERRRRRKWALRLQGKDITDSSPSSPERKKARVQRPLSAKSVVGTFGLSDVSFRTTLCVDWAFFTHRRLKRAVIPSSPTILLWTAQWPLLINASQRQPTTPMVVCASGRVIHRTLRTPRHSHLHSRRHARLLEGHKIFLKRKESMKSTTPDHCRAMT